MLGKKLAGGKVGKKGELTSQQLITIIIIIVSFSIILLFFLALNVKKEIGDETCRNSVVLRGTSLGQSVKLNCKTQDVCFTKGTGSCILANKDVTKIKVATKTEMLDEITDLMYSCWWQMGENKIDYVPSNWGKDKAYCAICNNIYLTDDLKNDDKIVGITNAELFAYMKGKKIPSGDKSLLFEFYGLNSIDAVLDQTKANFAEELGGTNPGDYKLPFNYKDGMILVTSQLRTGGWSHWVLPVAGGVLAGVGIALIPFTGGASAILTVKGAALVGVGLAAGSVTALIVGPGGKGQTLPPTLYARSSDEIGKLNCYEFSSIP